MPIKILFLFTARTSSTCDLRFSQIINVQLCLMKQQRSCLFLTLSSFERTSSSSAPSSLAAIRRARGKLARLTVEQPDCPATRQKKIWNLSTHVLCFLVSEHTSFESPFLRKWVENYARFDFIYLLLKYKNDYNDKLYIIPVNVSVQFLFNLTSW